MPLLEFARGPALAAALSIFALGLAWRLYGIFRWPAKRVLSAPRATPGRARGALAGLIRPRTMGGRTFVGTLNAYAYHIGLAIVFFGFVPHIAFIDRLTGLSWPAVPGWLFAVAVAIVFVGLGYALLARLTSPVLRLISNFDDYASWVVTILPLITGMACLHLALDARYPPSPAMPIAVAVHLLSLELLLVWLPFGKLAHAVLIFVSRGATSAAFARKGAVL